jgi:uncharacterized protein YjbI with pentapeptide repeats
LGEGTEDTRRRVFLDNLISEPLHPTERVTTVVERLADKENRLLVTSEVVSKGEAAERRAIVDVAHEALIRHWRLLRQWIEQNRDLLRQQRRIEASAVAWQEHQQSKGYLLQGLPLDEARQFQKQQADTFPLSDAARAFIQTSRRQRRWNRLKTASWLIIPTLLIGGIVEYNLREASLKNNYDRIVEQAGTPVEREAVEDRVAGCSKQGNIHKRWAWLDIYLTERLFGNCRSLRRADLRSADLRSADLRFADLRFADLINADLRFADLINADLSYADLSYADLSYADLINAELSYADLSYADLSDAVLINADLSSADLINADLSDAVLLETDLRNTNLTPEQLTGEDGPLICNAALPDTVTLDDRDRDCDAIPAILVARYGMMTEWAQQIVDDARQTTWEE